MFKIKVNNSKTYCKVNQAQSVNHVFM